MAKCTKNASIYEDLEKCPGQKKLPGIRDYVYSVSKRDIVTYPSVPDAPASLKEAAVAKGDYLLAADKYFTKVGIVKDDGQLQVENQGTDGCKPFKNTLTFGIPGTEEEATGYIDQMNNDEMIYLFFQRNGKARIIGSEDFSPELSLKQDTGKTATDANTTAVEAVVTDLHPPRSIRVRFTHRTATSMARLASWSRRARLVRRSKNGEMSKLTNSLFFG